MKSTIALSATFLALAACFSTDNLSAQEFDQPFGIESLGDIDNIAPIRQQILKEEEWLRWRKENIVPEVMRRVGVDMWLISRNERPLYYSLVPANYEGLVNTRSAALVFYDRGGDEGVEEIIVGRGDLAEIVSSRDPQKIGMGENASGRFTESLGSELASRFVVTDDLRTGFLEKRSPDEISTFHHAARVAYDIIGEAFSNAVIVPDVTTTDDVNWWIRQRYRELGLETSDHPTITIQRSNLERPKYAEDDEHFRIDVRPRNGYNKIIRRGDVIACDTGIIYYGWGTDTQQNAYVLLEDETDVPHGLKVAFDNTNRLQNHIAAAFEVGKGANDIVNDSLLAARADGLRPFIYGHPLPYYLRRYSSNGGFIRVRYGAGPGLGGNELLEDSPLWPPGGYPVYANTTYAMEIHTMTAVPEWGGQDVRVTMEQNVVMTDDGLKFLGGRQTEWYVIR